jgi:hypothetical protein
MLRPAIISLITFLERIDPVFAYAKWGATAGPCIGRRISILPTGTSRKRPHVYKAFVASICNGLFFSPLSLNFKLQFCRWNTAKCPPSIDWIFLRERLLRSRS